MAVDGLRIWRSAYSNFLDAKRLLPRQPALQQFAAHYLPGCEPRVVVRAWKQFARAMDSYPFCIPFMYYGPLNHAVQLPIEPGPLSDVPCGRSWMRDERGDVLPDSFKEYTHAEVVEGLGEVTRQWQMGVELLARGVSGSRSVHAQEELNTARVAGHCFRSGWNLYRAYPLRKSWKPSHTTSRRCAPSCRMSVSTWPSSFRSWSPTRAKATIASASTGCSRRPEFGANS